MVLGWAKGRWKYHHGTRAIHSVGMCLSTHRGRIGMTMHSLSNPPNKQVGRQRPRSIDRSTSILLSTQRSIDIFMHLEMHQSAQRAPPRNNITNKIQKRVGCPTKYAIFLYNLLFLKISLKKKPYKIHFLLSKKIINNIKDSNIQYLKNQNLFFLIIKRSICLGKFYIELGFFLFKRIKIKIFIFFQITYIYIASLYEYEYIYL